MRLHSELTISDETLNPARVFPRITPEMYIVWNEMQRKLPVLRKGLQAPAQAPGWWK